MNAKQKMLIKDYFYLTLADGIIAAAVYFFLIPSKAAVSSIAGLSSVLSNVVPLPISVITLIINVFLLIVGFITCGGEFGLKTVYTTVLLSGFLAVFEIFLPDYTSMTGSEELDVLCYVILVSVGMAICFNRNASSGGLDIVAKILNKYFNMEIGKALSVAGICIALTTVFFYDKKIVVLSLLGTYFNGIVVDRFIFGQNIKRRVCIISEKEEEIREFVIKELHSGATVYEAIGAYNLERRTELVTIVDRHEYQKLMAFLRKTDPKAFITVYTVSDIQYVVKKRD